MEHYAGIDVSLERSSVCVVDALGKIVKEAKTSSEPAALVAFFAPHGIALDSRGNLYVSEVSGTFGARAKRMPWELCRNHQIQKFARVG
jgi:hypothetical protein